MCPLSIDEEHRPYARQTSEVSSASNRSMKRSRMAAEITVGGILDRLVHNACGIDMAEI
jgi:hypothetical protein